MDDGPPQVLLSALIWDGKPKIWCRGDLPEHIGTYTEVASTLLYKVRMNEELGAIEYTPTTPQIFDYSRHVYVGTKCSEVTYHGAVFGDNMSPLVRICLPNCNPWPECFKPTDNLRTLAGPPFLFFDEDWGDEYYTGINPEYSFKDKSVVVAPDMPNQSLDDMEPSGDSGHEEDSSVGLGWHGNWVTKLLKRKDSQQRLGSRTDIIWDGARGWAIEVHLKAVSVTEVDPCIDEELAEDSEPLDSRGIKSYKVRATILRAFVRSPWLIRARQEAESQEEEVTDGSEVEDEDDVESM